MNTFVKIKHIETYDKVSYYSVVEEHETISLFEKFITAHETTNKNKFHHIVKWIDLIGNKYGAQPYLFRPEGETADTSALPPATNRKPSYLEDGKEKTNTLRLYCLRANEHVVFLFNGNIKTNSKAQLCSNVKAHFKLANQITKALDEAFKQKDIKWNETHTDIEFRSDLIIYL